MKKHLFNFALSISFLVCTSNLVYAGCSCGGSAWLGFYKWYSSGDCNVNGYTIEFIGGERYISAGSPCRKAVMT